MPPYPPGCATCPARDTCPGAKAGGCRHAPSRALILGLDGATFSLLDPLINRGLMPNLARVLQSGVRATLRSTDPYVTAPAWTSLVTGKRPDTHGVFDWSAPLPGSYRRRLHHATSRNALSFWDILARAGLPAGAINLPLSFPPSRDASFFVADMFTPAGARAWTWPLSLQADLEALHYRIDLQQRDYHRTGLQAFVHDLNAMTRARGQAIRHCLERYPWRAAIAVFVGPDRLQHAFWHVLDPEGPLEAENLCALSYFKVLDEELGRIVRGLEDSLHLYLVSDHGFGPHRGAFYINDWLEAHGYLQLHPPHPARRPLQRARSLAFRGLAQLHSLARQPWTRQTLVRLEQQLEGLEDRLGTSLTPGSPAVDWSRTLAFADTPHGVRLNLAGREPKGIVPASERDALIQKLSLELAELRDPRTGAPIHARLEPREARYSGVFTPDAPDLVYTFADAGYSWRIGRLAQLRYGRRLAGSFLAVDTPWETGTHRPDGVLMASGPTFQAGVQGGEVSLWDILPTMLYQLELPIPEDLEGRVLRELIRPEVLAAREECWDGPAAVREVGEKAQEGFAQEEEAQVADHLRALGYLS